MRARASFEFYFGVLLFVITVVAVVSIVSGCHDCDHNTKVYVNDPVLSCSLGEDGYAVLSGHTAVPAILSSGDQTVSVQGDFTFRQKVCPGRTVFRLDALEDGENLATCMVESPVAEEPLALGCVREPKVRICHKGIEIEVAESAVDAHLAHGDTLGPCNIPPEDCSDQEDNDGDGLVDCQDEDCADHMACQPPEVCDNGIDDDGDGLTDCQDNDCIEECAIPCVPGPFEVLERPRPIRWVVIFRS